jgi:hypothetical protein
MNKQILSEEFRRMQRLAGLITESQCKQLVENETETITITYIDNRTEDYPFRQGEIYFNDEPLLNAETDQEKQKAIATDYFPEKNINIDQMLEPKELADVLGYDTVKELAIGIVDKINKKGEKAEFKETKANY